jgi:hypothetical protein
MTDIPTWRERIGKPADYTLTFATPVEQALEAENNELRAARARQTVDTSNNAPWLTLAHMICTDAGIEPGHIITRLQGLRDALDAAGQDKGKSNER